MASIGLDYRPPSQIRTYRRPSSVVFLRTKEAFGGLSNMAGRFPLLVNGVRIRTSEALYQACRFPHLPDVQRLIIDQRSPMTAKMKGKPYRHDSRPDWSRVRVKVMRWCLRIKLAQNWDVFSSLLLDTGDREIVEQSRRDDFWGAKPVDDRTLKGMNVLGRLLMELRESVKAKPKKSLQRVEPLPIPNFRLYGRPIEPVTGWTHERPELVVGVPMRQLRQRVPESSGIQLPLTVPKETVRPVKEDPARYSEDQDGFSFEPYSKMTDSGVEWLGEVPAHWEVRRLRTISDMRVSNVDKHSRAGEQPVHLCNYVDVYKADRIRPGMPFMSATATSEEIEKFRLQRGDVLITKDSETWNDIGVPALVEGAADNTVCGYHLALLRPFSGRVTGEYLFQAVQSSAIAYQLHVRANGVTRFGLTHNAIKSTWLPVPPLPEQAAIVRFLDHADRRIQRCIRAKEKLIALLEEQKRAIIHEAVTGRINVRTGRPYPQYKDSGVEWLGEVPAHWEVRQLGRIGRLFKGGGGTKEDEREDGIPCVRYGDLYTHHRFFITASRACVSPERAVTAYTPLRYGDVLFAGSGETIDEIGKSAVNLIRGSACCGGDVIIFRPSIRIDPRFLGYASDCPSSACQKACMGRGFTVMHIYSSDLKYVTVAIPPLPEQAAIVRFLGHATGNIDAVVAGSSRQVERLREYRARLIADVVTGKIDVREATTGLPKQDPLSADEDLDDDFYRCPGSQTTGGAEEVGPVPDIVDAERSDPAVGKLMAEGR